MSAQLHNFLEYWFHRAFLHGLVWKIAHEHHHRFQTRLKIICTPMLPVICYAFCLTLALVPALGLRFACGILSGLAIGQLLMDGVHVIQHSLWRPSFLEVSRSWHAWHHGCDGDDSHSAHGLTCFFWGAPHISHCSSRTLL